MLDLIMSLFTAQADGGSVDVLGIINGVFGIVRSLMGLDQERYVL